MNTEPVLIPLSAFTQWLASGERSISSEAIVSHLTGQPVGSQHWRSSDWPRDPDDFRRCELLMEQVPITRPFFPRMATRSVAWSRLVASWDEIRTQIEAEAPEYMQGKGSARLAYQLMTRVIAGMAVCDTRSGSGNSGLCALCKGTGKRGGGRCGSNTCFRGNLFCPICRGNGYVQDKETAHE